MSDALRRAVNGSVEIVHEQHGTGVGEPMLLIMGFVVQRHFWPEEFCDELVLHGFDVVTFDNRDCGESTHLNSLPVPSMASLTMRPRRVASYRLEDMAADAVAVMDSRGWGSAHLMGVSMGGMIAQTLAIQHPGRVRSLTSISSTPSPAVGRPTLAARRILMSRPGRTPDELADRMIRQFRVIGSPGYSVDEEWLRGYAHKAFARGYNPAGARRQLAAVMASGSRLRALRGVGVPTLVVHGAADPMIRPIAGRMTANAIPGARLVMHRGMGHDLPRPLWSRIAHDVAQIARDAQIAHDAREAHDH